MVPYVLGDACFCYPWVEARDVVQDSELASCREAAGIIEAAVILHAIADGDLLVNEAGFWSNKFGF